MIQGLSKREKILLFSAGLVVVLYLSIQFVILPLASRYIDSVTERNHLREEQAKVDADIAQRPAIESENAEANRRFDELKQEYPLLVPNEEVVTTLTNLCILNGLSPSRLNITSTPPTAQKEGEDTAASQFTVITATVNVSGSYESLTKLLDEVDTKQYIRISNMSYSVNRQRDPTEPTTSSVTLNFELTYTNP